MFLTDLDCHAFRCGGLGWGRGRLHIHEQWVVVMMDRLKELEVLLWVDCRCNIAAGIAYMLVLLKVLLSTSLVILAVACRDYYAIATYYEFAFGCGCSCSCCRV